MKENNAMTSQCPQNGRSMIEMLGVLAIIGVLSVGGIMGYSKAMFRYKINKTIEQITYIAGNVRTTYANQGNYNGLGNDATLWKKAHIIPEDMWKGNYLLNVWEDYVYLDYAIKNSADHIGKAFIIEYGGISEEACIELITNDWKNAQVKMIYVPADSDYYFIPPAKLDDAVKICDNSSSLAFYFEIDTSDSMWKNAIDATTAALAGS